MNMVIRGMLYEDGFMRAVCTNVMMELLDFMHSLRFSSPTQVACTVVGFGLARVYVYVLFLSIFFMSIEQGVSLN